MLSHPLPQGERVTERAAHAASNPDFAKLNPGYEIATAHSPFARRVRRIGMARQGGAGRDVNHRAAAPPAHMRCDLFNPKVPSGQFDVKDPLPAPITFPLPQRSFPLSLR